MVDPIPDTYPRTFTYYVLDGAKEAIAFYQKVFGAQLRGEPMEMGGLIGHAELSIGDSVIMVADAATNPMLEGKTPAPGDAATLCVYVEDVDAVFAKALEEGATQISPVQDQFYGDRSGAFRDPWGFQWSPMTHVEDVTPEMMAERMAAMATEAPA